VNVSRTLVLTWGEEPHRIVSWQRAVCMVIKDKVDVLRVYDGVVPISPILRALPAVVKLRREVPRGRRAIRFGRMSVYLRDSFRCQYQNCPSAHPLSPEELTYDHVIPKDLWQGDKAQMTNWENIVTACWHCNQRKRNRTPAQAGMKLLRKPFRPTSLPPMPFFVPKNAPAVWFEWLQANDVIGAAVA